MAADPTVLSKIKNAKLIRFMLLGLVGPWDPGHLDANPKLNTELSSVKFDSDLSTPKYRKTLPELKKT